MNELRVPSNVDDNAIQEALMKLFNAQVRDQTESVANEGQANRAKRSVSVLDEVLKVQSSDLDQALKAADSIQPQFNPDQPKSESKTSRSV